MIQTSRHTNIEVDGETERQKDRIKETHRQREKRQRFTNIQKDKKIEWKCGSVAVR